jgi:MFS family permease
LAVAPATSAGDAPAGGQSFGTRSYRGYVLLSLTLVYTLNFIDRNLLGVVAQPIIAEFGLTDTEYGFLNGPPFALFYALMGIPIAIAADRYNRVVIMALCIAMWSLMTALCGFASSFVFLLIARVGVAIGEAGGTPPSNSIIADYFKPKSRANALGIFAMGVTLGGALANGFGGPIAGLTDETVVASSAASALATFTNSSAGARISAGAFAFIALGLPGVVIALVLLFTVKEPPRGYSDPPGTQRVQKGQHYRDIEGAWLEADLLDDVAGRCSCGAGWLWPVRLPGPDDAASARHVAGHVRPAVWRAAVADLCGWNVCRRLSR